MRRFALIITALAVAAPAVGYELEGRLAYIDYSKDPTGELMLVELPDGEPQRLTDDPGCDHHPALSPDGRRLAWAAERDGAVDIFLMELGPDGEGRDLRRLTETPAVEADLCWSTDGERIYFSAYGSANFGVYGLQAGNGENPDDQAGDERRYAAYYYDLEREAVEPLVVHPGDYRHPVHVDGLGVLCSYEPWSWTEPPFPVGLVLIHDALACDHYGPLAGRESYRVDDIVRCADGDLLLRVTFGSAENAETVFLRLDPKRGEIEESWKLTEPDIARALPDPACDGCGRFIVAAAEHRLGVSDGIFAAKYVHVWLYENAGEPSWAPAD